MLTFAVIGCGNIGKRHAAIIATKATLTSVCDIDVNKAVEVATKYNVPHYTSIEALLAAGTNTMVIVICTPNGLHAQQAILALEMGFHVIVEKPMALSSSDAYAMVAAASKAAKQLFVVKQNRFNPPIVAVKAAIDTAVLGKILSVQVNCYWHRDAAYYNNNWRGTMELDGGILFTQFSHFIDLLFWFMGDVNKVQAIIKNAIHPTIAIEDEGVINFEFNSGALGSMHYTINAFQKNMEGSITIFGEKGTVKIGGQYLNELEYCQIDNFTFQEIPVGNGPNNYGNYIGSMSNHGEFYDAILANFYNPTQQLVGVDAVKTVEIIEKIYLSTN